MDWGAILTTLITTIIIGGGAIFTFIIFFKQRKKKEDSDVVDKDASAAINMLAFTDRYQEFVDKQIIKYQELLKNKDKEIEKSYNTIIENQAKLYELETLVISHSKEIKRINNVLIGEQRKRFFAEKNICLVEDCSNRKPDKGTYKTNDGIIE